ncbi:MAG: S41 family peptidase, partial [Bacteroidetes bacterium]|nr:S41 family peptidase [Bacteroidota bacterium]MCL2301904.1 S41 family peptidase [Lentimicrobiaceae bacterium]
MKKLLLIPIFFITISLSAQNDFEIAKNVDIFVSILKELNAKYADEINPTDLVTKAIQGMLESLDPYSVYLPESQIEDLKLMTTGQYGGIGALIQQHGKNVVIAEPYENTPSQKAGLRAGDIILKINGQNVQDKNSSDISTILKGQPGTTLNIEIQRPTDKKRHTFAVKREEIKFPPVPFSGMLGNNVGYIKLDQFTEKASSEVKEAFLKLKEQGMKYLILDLRNNGGGLLHEAVNIMNIFVDQNVKIAETKGKIKEQNNVFKTRNAVIDKEIPVVVLVNENSASASEIVAGAFQDLDRGVVVGKKTFGKGLVQNIIPLSYNTSFKITVSKYYIPSGRCVQNVDYFNRDTLEAAPHIPDSLATPYRTKHGRIVYDKGGIEPDIITPDSIPSNILIALVLNNIIFDFSNEYAAQHETILPANQFKLSETEYNQFADFVKTKHFEYQTVTEELLKDLKEIAKTEKYYPAIESIYNEMLKKIENEKSNDIHRFKNELSEFIANDIVARYYYQKGRIEHQLATDPDV